MLEFCSFHLVVPPPSRLVSFDVWWHHLTPVSITVAIQGWPAGWAQIPVCNVRQGPWQVPRPGWQVSWWCRLPNHKLPTVGIPPGSWRWPWRRRWTGRTASWRRRWSARGRRAKSSGFQLVFSQQHFALVPGLRANQQEKHRRTHDLEFVLLTVFAFATFVFKDIAWNSSVHSNVRLTPKSKYLP